MQCECFNMTWAEDGKLQSHLEWPYPEMCLFTRQLQQLQCLHHGATSVHLLCPHHYAGSQIRRHFQWKCFSNAHAQYI